MSNHKHQTAKISLIEAFIPLIFLVFLLAINVLVFKDDSLSGTNQLVMLLGGAVAFAIGIKNKVSYKAMMDEVAQNVQSTFGAILILMMVGALSGAWLVSGVIPAMIYYGLKLINPTFFLPISLVVCSLVSIATGSSWTTSATVGVALIGIGTTFGINPAMVAGAVVSGAYFGDKLSPLSDTTNLAAAMAKTDLFTHIRYMTYTTVPTYVLSFMLFLILGFLNANHIQSIAISDILLAIDAKFYISPVLFIVPVMVVVLIVRKVEPLIALFFGVMLGILVALIFQPNLLLGISGFKEKTLESIYRAVMVSLTTKVTIATDNPMLTELFTSKGMAGMLNTVWLILFAMVFGGIMEAIGALHKITEALLGLFHSVLGLFAATVASCLTLNLAASDQYLAIVVPGKMFASAYRKKGLAPENLSRTLEDSGTVTSALIPWNTCGAYQAGVLGVSTFSYLPYAFFNILSPFMTIIFAAFKIKIHQLKVENEEKKLEA